MAKIAIIGTGYVGLVSGVALADFGHDVTCLDIDAEKIAKLKNGICPIYEPGLTALLENNIEQGRLTFLSDYKEAVENNDVIFICVGTPPQEDGSADLQYIESAAKEIGRYINAYKVIVNKSTVPIGTGRLVQNIIEDALKEREAQHDFDVVSNPEFLREGSAVYDFLHPDRIVIGTSSERARQVMRDVYRVFYLNSAPFIESNVETAEMIKYASNAFLAVKITYINEIANLCEAVGADVQQVATAMGKDGRISPKFLHAGPGYGGSCFPKDTRALAQIAQKHGGKMQVVEAAIDANEKQKQRVVHKICKAMGSLEGKTIAVLGLTFKPNTDDMRESPSLSILPLLVKNGAKIKAVDPQWKKEGPWRFAEIKDSLSFYTDAYEAAKDADALVLLTEWNCFRGLSLDQLKKSMKGSYFFDMRNVYDRINVENAGFQYTGVGR